MTRFSSWDVTSHVERCSCFSDQGLRDCFSFKLLSGEASSLKPGSTLCNQTAGSVGQENELSRHGDKCLSVCKGQLSCSFPGAMAQITGRPHFGLSEASRSLAQPGNPHSWGEIMPVSPCEVNGPFQDLQRENQQSGACWFVPTMQISHHLFNIPLCVTNLS